MYRNIYRFSIDIKPYINHPRVETTRLNRAAKEIKELIGDSVNKVKIGGKLVNEAGQTMELHFQPKVDVQSGGIIAMEALVRWKHAERGLVSPLEFIPLAEELGLIIPLGAWVLATACRQNKQWQDEGLPPLRVAVNLSAVQFRQKNLAEFIGQVLEDSGLDSSYLELEVTESVIMHNADEAARILEKLYAMGIHISIDDFGTGYSSLSYLRRFPLDTLKIDRSFVSELSSNPDDSAIVKSVIALAHSLRLRVVAEGVENEMQLSHLRSLGCDEYQGYHRSRPLPAGEFAKLLRQSKDGSPAGNGADHCVIKAAP